MNTNRFLASCAAAALFLTAGPAFAYDKDKKDDGKKGAPAQAAVVKGAGRGIVAARGRENFSKGNSGRYAEDRGRSGAYNVGSTKYSGAKYGGSSKYAGSSNFAGRDRSTGKYVGRDAGDLNRAYAHGGGHSHGSTHYNYAFREHSGWSHDNHYYWHGHHYGWYDDGWVIIDPGYEYGYAPGYYPAPDYGYSGGGSIPVQVQSALAREGYYEGDVDGLIGPATRSAIAAYQRDNGLPVTGSITDSLLGALGIG